MLDANAYQFTSLEMRANFFSPIFQHLFFVLLLYFRFDFIVILLHLFLKRYLHIATRPRLQQFLHAHQYFHQIVNKNKNKISIHQRIFFILLFSGEKKHVCSAQRKIPIGPSLIYMYHCIQSE